MSTSAPRKYLVQYSVFARKHYLKKFQKKYPGKQWDKTQKSIFAIMERADTAMARGVVKCIFKENTQSIVKMDFRVDGTKQSARKSGNRVIALVDSSNAVVTILLIYSKNEIGPPNETAKWVNIIKERFPTLRDLVK